jgi:UDP-N-acetylmuramoylalanine--D-glutamate ligase
MTIKQEWQGKKVTVVGLGIEGEDLARYFVTHGATVTVMDLKPRNAFEGRTGPLEALGVRLHLGENDAADAADADLVCVSQSVPLTNPVVAAAGERGIPIESMTSLFLDRWPGPIAGITGSSGKTTTTMMVDAIFGAAGRDHVLGGNVGIGAMSLLDEGGPDRWAVLEISHTQLVLTRQSPHVAGLLNVTPNHLDQFTWDEYVGLKRKIFSFQSSGDAAVFNADDPVSRELLPQANASVLLFSVNGDHGADGAFLEGGVILRRSEGQTVRVLKAAEVPLRGFHNVANATAATAIATACGIGAKAVAAAIRGFRAPEHRLEFVASIEGIYYYNDSIATAPERTLAALRSFEEPIILLLGGRDKKLPLDDMVSEAARRCRAVVCFGESGPLLARGCEGRGFPVDLVGGLAEAVDAAALYAKPGDVVLLSPACTSFDAYPNFEQRGMAFRQMVTSRAAEEAEP